MPRASALNRMRSGLNGKHIASLPPDTTITDPRNPGLRVRRQGEGAPYFELRYRQPGNKQKRRTMPLGRFRPMDDEGRSSIGLALNEYHAALDALARGEDPRFPAGPDGLPLEPAIEKYEQDMKRRGAVKTKDIVSLLRRELLAPLGNVPVGSIKRTTLLDRMREIEDSGRKGTARDFRTRVGVFLGWCTNEGYVEANVLGGYKLPRRTRKQMQETQRPGRALTDKELPALWRAAEAEGEPFGHFVRFLLLTGTRRQETALARWEDVDLKRGVWHLPEEVTKNGCAIDVPLPPMARAVLRELLPKEAKGLVFKGRDDKPMSGWTQRMKGLRDSAGIASWTLHDLRRTYRTGLSRLGVAETVAERALNHAVADELLAAYDRNDAWKERQAAGRAWARHVEKLLRPKPKAKRARKAPARKGSAKVIPLRA